MNNNSQHPGMANDQIDSMATNPYHQQSQQYLDVDAQPATDYTEQPTINPQPMRPDEWIQGGTILSDTTYGMGQNGIVERDNLASVNSTSDWEAQVRKANSQRIAGRTVYNTPPRNSGFTPYVDINDGKPPTKEELEKERNKSKISNLNNRLRVLAHDRQVARLKLASIDRGIKTIETELEDLENN